MSDAIFSRLKKKTKRHTRNVLSQAITVEGSHFENQDCVSYTNSIEPNSIFHSLKHQLIKWLASEFPSQLKSSDATHCADW
jgi:hypothetical protein